MIGDVEVKFTVVGRVSNVELTREQAEHLLRQLQKALKVTGKAKAAEKLEERVLALKASGKP